MFCSFVNLLDIESIRVKEKNFQKGDSKQKEVSLRNSKHLLVLKSIFPALGPSCMFLLPFSDWLIVWFSSL